MFAIAPLFLSELAILIALIIVAVIVLVSEGCLSSFLVSQRCANMPVLREGELPCHASFSATRLRLLPQSHSPPPRQTAPRKRKVMRETTWETTQETNRETTEPTATPQRRSFQ
jgi:hypothetical protein